MEFFHDHYGSDDRHPEAFRSIDDLPNGAYGSLALRLDSHINNLSLVLALQLPGGGVLLFPGDAQGGNWKSWAALDAPLAFRDDATDAHKLLAATVFYQVAHHGSHNATPRTYGLDLMTSPQLRAFVPVDHAIAFGAGYGEMPLVAIVQEVTRKTGGAVIQSDSPGNIPPPAAFRTSEKLLRFRVKKDSELLERPLWCETDYPLN